MSPAVSSRLRPWPGSGGYCVRSSGVSAGIGIAILAAGVVALVLAGYNWLVLVLTWAFVLLHLGLLARTGRLRRRTQALGKP